MEAIYVEYQTCTDTDKDGFYGDVRSSRYNFTIKESINLDNYRDGLEFVTDEFKYSNCKTVIVGGNLAMNLRQLPSNKI